MKDTTKQLLAGCGIFLAGMIVGEIVGEIVVKQDVSKKIDALYEAGGAIYIPVEPKQKEVYVNCTVE